MPAISPPPPTGTKIASIGSRLLAQDLHADRALPRDHVGVVVGMHERRARCVCCELQACA